MDKAAITAAWQQAGLQQLTPVVDKLALPSVRLVVNPSFETALQPGQSKIGGLPDLPANVTWPQLNGAPMGFVAQVQLADVHSSDAAGLLPSTGVLSFFYDASQQTFGSDPKDKDGFKIFYLEQPATELKRTDLPTDLPSQARYRVCSVDFDTELTLPLQPKLEIDSLQWSETDQQKYDTALQGLTSSVTHPIHRMLGHPDTIQDDMRMQCQLAANGVADPGADPQKVAALSAGANDWTLLLQVDSNQSVAMQWANAGMLYFWIRRQDLTARKFDQAWVVLQSE